MTSRSLLLIVSLLVVSFTAQGQTEQLSPAKQLGQVYELIISEDQDKLLITSTGTWQVKEDALTRVGDGASLDLAILPEKYRGTAWGKSHWLGVGYVIVIIVLSLVYLAYQASLNKRRREYYERIKVQQKILGISLLATGEEIIDCDIAQKTMDRLNPNANFLDSDKLHFSDEGFLSRIHEDDRGVVSSQFDTLLRGGTNDYEVTYRLRDQDGNWIWVAERGCVIERDKQGHALRLVASLRDITIIMQQQEQLTLLTEELEKRLRRAQLAQQN